MIKSTIDVNANRSMQKYRPKEQLGRVFWGIVQPAFRFSPRQLWGWRRLLLRLFGAKVGHGVHIYPTVKITMPWNLKIEDLVAIGDHARLYALGEISIGQGATISQYAHLCAGSHDVSRTDRKLLKDPVVVGNGAWIAADSFVGPGVTIGSGAIVGARAVAVRDVADLTTVVGNPAQVVSDDTPGNGE